MTKGNTAIIIYHFESDTDFASRTVAAHLGFGAGREEVKGGPIGEMGRLVYQGSDALGRRVFTLARGDCGPVVELMLHGIPAVYRLSPSRVASVNLDRLTGRAPHRIASSVLAGLPEDPKPEELEESRPWPKIFYICYGAAHSSVVAAAVHAGLLPHTRTASAAEIGALRDFDQAGYNEIGRPILIGHDQAGREIYALGLASAREYLHATVHQLVHQLGLPPKSILTIDALKGVTWRTRIGGFLSRRAGLIAIGRRLCLSGLVVEYPRFLDMVLAAKQRAAELGSIDSGAALVDNNQERREEREGTSGRKNRGNHT